MKRKLRIGILLDSMIVHAWVYHMIQDIKRSEYASIELVVLKDVPLASKRSLFTKIKDHWGSICSLLVRRGLDAMCDRLVHNHRPSPDAFEEKDLTSLLSGVMTLRMKPVRKGFCEYFHGDDLDQIKAQGIDVLLRHGFRILRGGILKSARYGIWSYHHGDNRINRGGPPGFWETMESWPETGSILQILTDDLDNGVILTRSFSSTDRSWIGHILNNYYWKTLSFIPRKLKELWRFGEEEFFNKVEQANTHPVLYSRGLYRSPTNRELFRLLLRKSLEKAWNRYISFRYFNQWILMFDIRNEMSTSFWRFRKIFPPKDRFWADPHILKRNNMYYNFIEEYIFDRGKGTISLIVMDEKGNYGEPVVILERSYHISYPFVFESDGELYMVPDTGSNRTIEIYKCVEFPSKWEFQMNLMENIKASDASFHYSDGTWWLFATVVENEGASECDELFLFHSNELLTNDWTPHPMNPIVSDVKSSRPAGRLFERNGKLYRPSQNCAIRYGYGFNLSEVRIMSPHEYRENIIASVTPKWDKNIFGCHTFSHLDKLTVIDALMRRRR